MDSDQLPCLDMDTDLYIAVMTGDMGYFHNNIGDLWSIPCKAAAQEQSVLHIAANFKCIDFAKYLVALFPVLLTRADLRGDTPLHIASKRGCSEMVACFLESQVSEQALEMKNEMDDTALHVAVRNGHLEVVKLLVQKNSMLLDLVNNHKESPLYLAVERGFLEIAKFMLEGYSSICSCEGTQGTTALHAAVIHSHKELSPENLGWPVSDFFLRGYYFRGKKFKDEVDIMELLMEKKKDVIRQADELGWSPLHYAAHLGHHEATKKLLAADRNVVGMCDVEQSCALHVAAKNGHSKIIEEILACRPDVYNLVDYKGRTILHIAAQFGQAGVVKCILKKPNLESLINEPDKEGNTAFHLAAIHRHYWVVNTFAVDNRVDKRAMNNKYLKAIDILHSNIDDGRIIKYWVMKKLKHNGCVQSFRHCVTREQTNLQNGGNEGYQENANTQNSINGPTAASNTSTQGSQGVFHIASCMSTLGERNREVMKENEQLSHHLNGICEIHLLVAALIATVTFAAGISPPGGFREEDLHQGEAVFLGEMAFKGFFISDVIAFYFSTTAVFLHFYASIQQNYHLRLRSVNVSAILIFLSFVGMTIAFSFSIFLVGPNMSGLSSLTLVLACLFLASYMFGIL